MKKALDTNVLVRALVHDGSRQSSVAASLFEANELFVPLTVALETEWVLRTHFGLNRRSVNSLFVTFLSRDHIEVEQRDKVESAVVAHREGWDFADALHVFAASEAGAFLTFDRKLTKFAAKHGSPVSIETPELKQLGKTI